MCDGVMGFIILVPLLFCMFEIFCIKTCEKKENDKRRELVARMLKLEIIFSPQRTAITFSPAFPSLPFNKRSLCVDAFTTLKSIQLCQEKSHSSESLLHENFNSPWYLHDPSCLSSASHNEFWRYKVGSPQMVCTQAYTNEWTSEWAACWTVGETWKK